jgi:hypothetical protein
MYKLYSVILLISTAMMVGCGSSSNPPGPTPDALVLTCPPDTVIPINEPTDPDSTGLVPEVESSCMDEPTITYSDSTPMAGGLVRIWTAADTCGNADTCLQHIGLGAPVFKVTCPRDTVIPINCSAHPDSLGLYPLVEGSCGAQPDVGYTDVALTGGIERTWIVSDTCGHADTCLQSIGLGAPGFSILCPADTVIPANCPFDPASLGLYPQVVGSCDAQPLVSYTDLFIPGGIERTWIALDAYGNTDTCMQSIGQGAPDSCD